MVKQYYKKKNYEARKSVGYLIRRTRNLITAQIEDLFAEQEVTFVQYIVMMYLRDGIANTCSDVCRHLCYDTGAFTRLIDQMEKRKLLKRSRNARDRRTVTLLLTDLGRRKVESLIGLLADYYNELLKDFSRKEADNLVKLLTKMVSQLSDREK